MPNERLLKRFSFERANHSRLTLSDPTKIRRNPDTCRLELKPQSYNPVTGDPRYPTDTNLYVRTWVTHPETLIKWEGFSITPYTQPTGTSVRFKLNDGTNDRYWSGASWAIASTDNWNTEEEIAAHIATFPVSSKQLGVVAKLATTDETVMPSIEAIELLMVCDLHNLQSLIADSIMAQLEEDFTLGIDTVIASLGGNKPDLRDLETKYVILGILAVYDHTTDPQHLTNLYQAYDSSSKTITLTSSVSRGNALWITFEARPKVYLDFGSQDYLELYSLPAIIFERFTLSGNSVAADWYIINKAALTATRRMFPLRLNLTFDVVLQAEKNRTLLALIDRGLCFSANRPLIKWRAIDEYLSLTVITEALFAPRANLEDIHESRFSVKVHNIYLWLIPEETLPLVQRLNISLENASRGGPLWTGVKEG